MTLSLEVTVSSVLERLVKWAESKQEGTDIVKTCFFDFFQQSASQLLGRHPVSIFIDLTFRVSSSTVWCLMILRVTSCVSKNYSIVNDLQAMAPPVQPFPVSELPNRSREYMVNYKRKIRKPPVDFETCDLYEIVQYSCITKDTSGSGGVEKRQECFPFVRLFRRCGQGEKMYHIETTAWEGEHAYATPSSGKAEESKSGDAKHDILHGGKQETKQKVGDMFARYGEFFWSKR